MSTVMHYTCLYHYAVYICLIIHIHCYIQSAPGVRPIKAQQNPATWMLEAIGAGTVAAVSNTDFARYYKESALCAANIIYTDALCNDSDTTSPATEKECRYVYRLYILYVYFIYSVCLHYIL